MRENHKINFTGLGHINIVVENIEEGSEFYEKIFNAIPIQEFPHFRNIGFAKAAGFLEKPENVDVTIRFLEIPGANIFLELMEYHTPRKLTTITEKLTYELGGPRHICLKVTNIDDAFNFVKEQDGVKLINLAQEYKPHKIDSINPEDFLFFDDLKEKNPKAKQEICDIIGNIRYFYFIDRYGVQWEFEQGHTDVG